MTRRYNQACRSVGRRPADDPAYRSLQAALHRASVDASRARRAAWRRSLAALVVGVVLGGAVPSLALLALALTL
jgi:hypothetical protein